MPSVMIPQNWAQTDNALSLTMPVVTRSSVNTVHKGGKKREIVVKSYQCYLWSKNTDMSDVWEKDCKNHL